MPPTGPRGGSSTNTRQTRSSTGASRPPARGGIAKRGRGPAPRVDRDGDLVMDAAAANKSGAGINKNNSSTRRGTTRPSGPRANTRLQQNLARQLGGDTSLVPKAPSAARLAANNTTLKVLGVKSSKAATNPDGGEKRLLEFLERKASTFKGPSRRQVTVKKVCQGIRSMDTEGHAAPPTVILVTLFCPSRRRMRRQSHTPIVAAAFPMNPKQFQGLLPC